MIFFCRCRSTAFSYWYVVVGAKLADSWWTPFYEWREISLQLRTEEIVGVCMLKTYDLWPSRATMVGISPPFFKEGLSQTRSVCLFSIYLIDPWLFLHVLCLQFKSHFALKLAGTTPYTQLLIMS
ncbi:hypothetical protein POPTR_001G054850v4 [Populus trichocarpa]|uniref:Uncharacterized protein n=1 Tax=Populus trichocarpa TaxID=3694 RepID=A0ACC0THK9_POPTR|nr:hypothetical protein POPTR_001G054850v4 [Populus trichocarpa]